MSSLALHEGAIAHELFDKESTPHFISCLAKKKGADGCAPLNQFK